MCIRDRCRSDRRLQRPVRWSSSMGDISHGSRSSNSPSDCRARRGNSVAVYGDLTNVAAEWSFPNVSDRRLDRAAESSWRSPAFLALLTDPWAVSYTHLRAHETVLD